MVCMKQASDAYLWRSNPAEAAEARRRAVSQAVNQAVAAVYLKLSEVASRPFNSAMTAASNTRVATNNAKQAADNTLASAKLAQEAMDKVVAAVAGGSPDLVAAAPGILDILAHHEMIGYL
ncbi:phosphoribosyl-ATP pyrophosphatase [Striga asiatica]|uniref:Phosphoribosyl-ATP pyrophosphatase n=1 Tax=Striga asiatica TaxID=4170 RepID=A0A5A7Q4W6_STRAF|nr:phosphoribosyl-ATP pyrophosphatase [Striga asiatica]